MINHIFYSVLGSGVWKTYDQITEKEFETCINTNARGLLTAAQLICPKMEKNGGGVVGITGATASWRGKPFTAAFAAGKSAQRMLSQSLGISKFIHFMFIYCSVLWYTLLLSKLDMQ